MREGVVVSTVRSAAEVHGVHASAGRSRWACLARRTGLHGAWEAVEWAWLPPGGVSGEHLHSRTEEVYVILTGRGEITLDGRPHAVRPGDAVLTGLGTRHGLRSTGDEPLSWLVVELPAVPPAPPRARPGTPTRPSTHTIRKEAPSVNRSAVIHDLRRFGTVDPGHVLTGPLRALSVRRLQPGTRLTLQADGVEHTVFVTAGTGEARAGLAVVPLGHGTGLTLPLGTAATMTAGPGGLEYFHAVLAVPGGREHERRHGPGPGPGPEPGHEDGSEPDPGHETGLEPQSGHETGPEPDPGHETGPEPDPGHEDGPEPGHEDGHEDGHGNRPAPGRAAAEGDRA